MILALGVPTKIARGTIEIVNEVHLVKKTLKVGASEATLLNMLNISPFTYGMVVLQVYDSGNVFAPAILDIEEDALLGYFTAAIGNVASISLAISYPTIVSVSHSLVNSYKNLLAISVETDYDFEGSEKVLSYLHGVGMHALVVGIQMLIGRLKRTLLILLRLRLLRLLHRMRRLLQLKPRQRRLKKKKRVMTIWAWIYSVRSGTMYENQLSVSWNILDS